MTDSSRSDRKDLRADEAQLQQLEQEELSLESGPHHGFVDESRRTQLESESESEETRIMHEKEEIADDHD